MNVRLKLLLLIVLTLMMWLGVCGYIINFYRDSIESEEDLLLKSNAMLEQSHEVKGLFQNQLNEWKNVLLRGDEPRRYHQFLSAFYRTEKLTHLGIRALAEATSSDPLLSVLVDDLQTLHLEMGRVLRRSVQRQNDSDEGFTQVPIDFLSGLEDQPIALLKRITNMLAERRTLQLSRLQIRRAEKEQFVFTLIALFVFGSVGATLWIVDKNIAKPAQQAAYLAEVIENVQSIARFGTWDWDSRKNLHRWSRGVFEILGIDPETNPSTECFLDALDESERQRVREIFDKANQNASRFEFEARVRLPDGGYKDILQRGEVKRVTAGKSRMTSLIYDISELKAAEEKLSYLASYDSLTGLPNRALFLDRLEHAIYIAKRNEQKVGLIFLDLDQFKAINDAMGHAAGDALLMQVANRLKSTVREADTAARLGGDEFTVIMERVQSAEDLERVVDQLLKAINGTYLITGESIHVSTSMGVTLFPEDAQDAQGLLKNADSAMYLAKEKGRQGFEFFTKELDHRAQRRLVMENHLRSALDKGEFQLFYQPVVDLESGRVVSAEALLRWFSSGDIIGPSEFVPSLEDTGLIRGVGEWVLKRACEDAMRWQDRGFTDLRVAVNMSVRQLRQGDMADRVQAILNSTGLPAALLELEITESTLIDSDVVAENLKLIKGMGVLVAIDDFGSGYSSLGGLRDSGIDRLKMDPSFISDARQDSDKDVITAALIGLSSTLGLELIAEGVETSGQYQYLKRLNCQMIQGYLIARPMPADSFVEWLSDHRLADSTSARWESGDGQNRVAS